MALQLKPIIHGSSAPIQLNTEYSYDPIRGLTIQENWESAGDGLGGIANGYLVRQIAFNWVRSPRHSKLTATISGGQGNLPDIPAVSWQLLANEVQKDVFESPMAVQMEANYPGSMAKLRSTIQHLTNNETVPAEDDPVAGAAATFDELTTLLLSNTTHFATGQYALKRTYSVSNFYAGALPGEGLVGRVLPTAAIVALGMPTVIGNAISSITPQSISGYIWGWRQLPSTIVTGANNRSEVNTEWWLDTWRPSLYPAA